MTPSALTDPHPRQTTRDLLTSGLRKRDIAAAVATAQLIRPRIGNYLTAGAPEEVQEAVAVGGRLGCLSALRSYAVFVLSDAATHIHLPHSASRVHPKASGAVWHREALTRGTQKRATRVDVVDALVQSARCQGPREWIASVDSALHQRLIDDSDIDAIFANLPRRWRRMRLLIDRRAESGPETLVRLMARTVGFDIRLQVLFVGIGRVDLLLDGWLVVECDSKAHHQSWEQQLVDRRRDQQLAAIGHCVYRPVAEDILYHPDLVTAALRGLREAGRRRA